MAVVLERRFQDVFMIAERMRVAELMDDPALDAGLHRQALAGLRRINRLSRSAAALWPFVRDLGATVAPKPVRILDLACGSGDNIIALARHAKRRGIAVECAGCDVSPVAVDTANEAAVRNHAAGVSFVKRDVLNDSLPDDFDVLTCSLFMHHLTDQQAADLLRRMAAAARQMVLLSDLRRTRLGMTLAWIAGRTLTRSPVVAVDAIRSVAAAFDDAEVARLAERSGLHNYQLVHRWPQRWVLCWRKP